MNFDFVHKRFSEIALLYPNKIAIQEEEGTHKYCDLLGNAKTLATILLNLGVERQEIIGVAIGPSEKLIRSIIGIFINNAIYLPIDLAFSKKRISEIFNDNECQYLLTDEDNVESIKLLLAELQLKVDYLIVLGDGGINILWYKEQKYVRHTTTFYQQDKTEMPDPDDGNYIVYTSGTTGRGNAILGAHKSLAHFIKWEIEEFGIDRKDKISMLSQHTFDASFRDIFVPLCSGATLYIPSEDCKNNFMTLIEWLDESKISLMHCVPSLFRMLTQQLEIKTSQNELLKSLKRVLMAGEPLYAKDINRWQSIFGPRIEIVNLYGTSETTLAKTFHRINDIPDNPSQILHVGKPIPNTFVAILSSDRICRIGEIGEIYISTSYMTKGYLNNELLNQQAFVKNPFIEDREVLMHKTGDQGRYLHDRNIEVLGRLDEQVKVNGIRVELIEVDQAVMSLEEVEAATTIVHKVSNNLVEMVCYYISKTLNPEQLPTLLPPIINQNLIPGHFMRLEEFPLTLNGKIDKKSLPKPEQILKQAPYEPPRTAIEHKLEQIWKEVLELKKIGINTSFFKIGGRSIKAMQMVSRIYQEINVNVKISAVLTNPTICKLAKVIEELQKSNTDYIPQISPQEHYALSSAQKSIWLLCNYDDKFSRSFNILESFLLQGEVEVISFEKAFKAIISRHESLRTNFIVVDGQPRQKISPENEFDFKIEYLDLSDKRENIEYSKTVVYEESQRTFNLESEPLIRIKLIKLKKQQFILVFSVHHIIADGWSLEILAKEFGLAYNSFLHGNKNPFQPLRIQYKDFSDWQNAKLDDEQLLNRLANYWQNQFYENVNLLDFGYGKSFTNGSLVKGDLVSAHLDPELARKLKAIAENQDVTLFMVLISFYYALLYQFTGQSDIVIGCPATDRTHPDLENQIGFYLNTLPFRLYLQDEDSYLTLLDKVKDVTSSGIDHQLYPFHKLVEDLSKKGLHMGKPLFNVMFDMLEFSADHTYDSDFKSFEISRFNLIHNSNKSDLILYANIENNTICLYLGYNTTCFIKSKVNRMLNRLIDIMNMAVVKPSISLKELAMEKIDLPAIDTLSR